MRQINLNRQLLGLEDILFGVGTTTQTRGGQQVDITKINAGNMPFDETQTLLEWAQSVNLEQLGDIIVELQALYDNLNNINLVANNLDIIAEKLNISDYTAESVLARLLTVDGSGSGVDADLLDGQEGSWYQQALVSGTNIKTLNGLSLLGSGDFNLTIGSGGYAANVYLTNLVSTTNGSYKQLRYTPDVAEVILTGVANNNEVLVYSSIFDGDVKATGIPSGEWGFHFHRSVDNTAQETKLRFEVFKRSAVGVETVLFSTSSKDINDVTFVREDLLVTQPTYNVDTTDRIGLKVYASTTRTSNTTVSFKIGDGEAAFINTPLQIRHNQLRARDEADSHPISAITGLQDALDDIGTYAEFVAAYNS